MRFKFLFVVFFLALTAVSSQGAEVIELPEEELAKESVLPVFDNPPMVKSRNVVTEKRFELGGFYGTAMTEPIANLSKFGLVIYYHTSEDHAFGFLYSKNSTGLSDYARQLDTQFNLDFSRAPSPDQTMMLDYNLKMFYGKMSLSKETALNLSLFGTAAVGQVKYVHKSYTAFALGVGQRFYFNPRWAFRFDFRLYGHQAPIPFLAGNPGIRKGTQEPAHSRFEERMTYTNNMEFGVSYLF